MSIKQVQDKINYLQETASDTKFMALIYCFVSSLDLDGLSRTLIIKWFALTYNRGLFCIVLFFSGHCRLEMKGRQCENSECPTVFDNQIVESEVNFDIRIMLTDHTGTLTNCRFSGQVAEQALNCTVRHAERYRATHLKVG